MQRLRTGPLAAGAILAAALPATAAPVDYNEVRGRGSHGSGSGILEGEALPMLGDSRIQGMRGFGPHWSGDAHLLWMGEIGESMETRFNVGRAGRHEVSLAMTLAPDYGVFSIRLDGGLLVEGVDFYGPKVALAAPVDLGEVELAAGSHTLTFTLTGSNPAGRAKDGRLWLLGLDHLRVTPLDPPPEPEKHEPGVPPEPRPEIAFGAAQPLLASYCYGCHGEKGKVKGKLDLTVLNSREDFLGKPELARKLIDVLAYREMPPEDADELPSAEQYETLAGFFEGVLVEHFRDTRELPPVTMRRMNRYEYNNAVRDLLQLRGDIYPLPEKVIRPYQPYFNPASGALPQRIRVGNRALGKNQIEQHLLTGVAPFAIDLQAEHGFNNRGDELGFSPILMESFLKLSRAVVHSPEFDAYSAISRSFFAPPPDSKREDWPRMARERLGPFLERAFRAPVADSTADRYLDLFEREIAGGAGFQEAMKDVVAAALASPRFLYLLERKREAAAPLSPYELAGRLSFFLWSSIPDEPLLADARSGDLARPEVYDRQVRRMLLDPRSKALSENFARQWLRLDRLITAVPDFDRFGFYYSRIGCEQWKLGLQTMVEPLLLFESIMVEDRSIMLLVDSNYSYRSGEMDSWYRPGVPFGGKGNRNRFGTFAVDYRRVPVNSRREGGVITCAATLTMNATPLRTSPITRGAWVADVIFNRPPPPPPDEIPEIEADDAKIEAEGKTLRQRLIAHQVNPSCVSCHQKIDPLGFALENYDAVGRWRDTYGSGLPIDASGELFGRAKFDDAVGLKDAILAHPEWFMRGFLEHLLSYALGRRLELADRPAVDAMLAELMAVRGQFSVAVGAVARSYPFLHKPPALDSR